MYKNLLRCRLCVYYTLKIILLCKSWICEIIINIKDYISIDPEILGGQPVFKGIRVPIETLFLHLERGVALDEFLEDFPTVNKEQAIKVLRICPN